MTPGGEVGWSNHFSGPDLSFPHADARLDISDLYVFPTPGVTSRSVLVMNVHPSISINPPGQVPDDGFAPEAVYSFNIDTDADAVANVSYQVRFSPRTDGAQTATLERSAADGPSEAILTNVPVSTGAEVRIAEAGGYRLFVGPRSDPFFADVAGTLNGLQFTGSDSMASMDVYAIVLEVPNHA